MDSHQHDGYNKRQSPTSLRRNFVFAKQTDELLYAVYYTLLAREGKFVNGFTPERNEPNLECVGSKQVYESLLGACEEFCSLHRDELSESVDTLDMSDVKVYDTFHETVVSIFDEINWGRMVSAVCLSKTMALRALKEGKPTLVESILGWLQLIFLDKLQSWILEQGNWVTFPNKFHPDRLSQVEERKEAGNKSGGSSLLALAAAGVGIFVVTSILGR